MKKYSQFVLFSVLCIVAASSLASPRAEFLLTSNAYSDRNPAIYGSNIAWTAYNITDIFWYDGTTTRQITSNLLTDDDVHISANTIAWNRYDGSDWEIMKYDMATGITTQITNNNYDDKFICLSGKNIAWEGKIGYDYDVFYYNGGNGQTTQVTNDSNDDFSVQLDGDKVVWQHNKYSSASTDYNDIYMYNGTTGVITMITNDSSSPYYCDSNPYISGNKVVWLRWHKPQGIYAEVANVRVYDITTGVTSILTNTDTDHMEAKISGNMVTYQSKRPDYQYDLNIWNANDQTTTLVSTGIFPLNGLSITDKLLAYCGFPGGPSSATDIMLWSKDGGLERITNNQYIDNNPRLYGGSIVWYGYLYTTNSEEILLSVLCGDADKDGFVDIDDLEALAANWRQDGQWHQGDFNRDGRIDQADLDLMAENWAPEVGDFAAMCINLGLASPDANDDGCVGFDDMAIMAAHWGDGPLPPAQWQDGDFNGDEEVNIADLRILAVNWLDGCDM